MSNTSDEIRSEIMSMDYADPKAVAIALEHIADKLCELEHSRDVLTEYKQDRPRRTGSIFDLPV